MAENNEMSEKDLTEQDIRNSPEMREERSYLRRETQFRKKRIVKEHSRVHGQQYSAAERAGQQREKKTVLLGEILYCQTEEKTW